MKRKMAAPSDGTRYLNPKAIHKKISRFNNWKNLKINVK